MTDFFYLIPIALALGAVALGAFMWSLRSGQYDDLAGAAERILFEDRDGPGDTAPARGDKPSHHT
ncbi:cbb3-type cytochrome oxidase assembly protein CcoS [Bradyrhizobium sp. SYSU BS000235]|uniref:cbb3-type cytochrome oxidase assembly protein CcoS n=1 Tax=Bradyrhizobium sp. SYSU BS000235 TaxID=3411332 RepID=UPI003C790BBA